MASTRIGTDRNGPRGGSIEGASPGRPVGGHHFDGGDLHSAPGGGLFIRAETDWPDECGDALHVGAHGDGFAGYLVVARDADTGHLAGSGLILTAVLLLIHGELRRRPSSGDIPVSEIMLERIEGQKSIDDPQYLPPCKVS